MARISLPKFDRDATFVLNHAVTVNGESLAPGQFFPKHLVTTRKLKQLFELRKISIVTDVDTVNNTLLDLPDAVELINKIDSNLINFSAAKIRAKKFIPNHLADKCTSKQELSNVMKDHYVIT